MSEVVVPASWVTERLADVTAVDVRDEWEFDGIGHLPGAVNIPFDRFRSEDHDEGGEGMLPGEDAFAALLGEAGISREDRIVAYDDHHGVFAARFLVTAELYGHLQNRLHLLDGDFSAWQREYDTTTDGTAPEPTTYETRPPTDTPLVDAETVAGAVEDSDTVIVDTREQWEFEEAHIPGAVRLDWRQLVDDTTRGLKPREEVESILAAHGITRDSPVLLYCNTARRISHTYTVLRHLGYEDVGFYEGSLTEWQAADRPVEP